MNPGISIRKPKGMRVESSHKPGCGPKFARRNGPKKMARGMNYGPRTRHS